MSDLQFVLKIEVPVSPCRRRRAAAREQRRASPNHTCPMVRRRLTAWAFQQGPGAPKWPGSMTIILDQAHGTVQVLSERAKNEQTCCI